MPYTLPELDYSYSALEPQISARTLELHHSRHHAGYVKGANEVLEKLAQVRERSDSDYGSLHHDLAFNVSGHLLHTSFWKGIGPGGGGNPEGELKSAVDEFFGSVRALRREMSIAANGVQGSGWAVLAWESLGGRLIVGAVRDHQVDAVQGSLPLLVIDAWEHAYYPQYENRRDAWVDAFWEIVNWREVGARFDLLRTLDAGPGVRSGPVRASNDRSRPARRPHGGLLAGIQRSSHSEGR